MGGEIIWKKISISKLVNDDRGIFTFTFEHAALFLYPESILIVDEEGKGKPTSFRLEKITKIKLKKKKGLKKVD